MSRQLLIITAPSGAGKTTIVRYLLGHFRQLAFSISATTRPKETMKQMGLTTTFWIMIRFRKRSGSMHLLSMKRCIRADGMVPQDRDGSSVE